MANLCASRERGSLRGQARASAERAWAEGAAPAVEMAWRSRKTARFFRQRGAVLEVSLSVKVLAARLPGRAIIS